MLHNKVLLVEDDDLSCFMMEEMLEELGLPFEVARNGQDCVDVLTKRPGEFTSVLMDIHMPVKTGVEALADIRSAPNNPPKDLFVVAVTADIAWHSETTAKAQGFNTVLAKPVSMSGLEKVLT